MSVIDRRWEAVEGWLADNEGDMLQLLASGKRVLELGAWKGRSTVCLALVATKVVSIDWHRGDNRTGDAFTLPSFVANIEAFGVRGRIVPIVARIEDAWQLLAPASFDLVFIDDDHGQTVAASTLAARTLVRPGGVIAWHDSDEPKVQRCIESVTLGHDVGRAGSLTWFETSRE